MTMMLLYGMAAGLGLALACGDSERNAAAAPPQSTATRPARAPIDVCALLTPAEAEAIMGKPVAAPDKGSGRTCTYTAQTGSGEIMLHALPQEFGSKEEFHAFLVKNTEKMNARIKESLKKTGATAKETAVEPVPEAGSPAYYVDPTLIVLKEGRVLSILARDRKQAVAVAGRVLPRF